MSHVFVSYVREDAVLVDQLRRDLERVGVEVWLDRERLEPGQRWRGAIHAAIQSGACFIACFSSASAERARTYMNEELTVAIEELRQRPTDRTWFIPLLLSEAAIPDRDIGGGETLRDLHFADLAADWEKGVADVARAVQSASHTRRRTSASRGKSGAYMSDDHSEEIIYGSKTKSAASNPDETSKALNGALLVSCGRCKGTGSRDRDGRDPKCVVCDGAGKVLIKTQSGKFESCNFCGGDGTQDKDGRDPSCPVCGGVGGLSIAKLHIPCAKCAGTGTRDRDGKLPLCETCKGVGVVGVKRLREY